MSERRRMARVCIDDVHVFDAAGQVMPVDYTMTTIGGTAVPLEEEGRLRVHLAQKYEPPRSGQDRLVAALREIAALRKMYCGCESMPGYDIREGCEHEPSPHVIAERALSCHTICMTTTTDQED